MPAGVVGGAVYRALIPLPERVVRGMVGTVVVPGATASMSRAARAADGVTKCIV
jgi:hypothetical protein